MDNKKKYSEFRWVIFGLCVASLTIVFIAAWLIVRICDNNWTDFRLPAILAIIFVVTVAIGAMFASIPEIKKEIEKDE